jgi:hypothetical protein
MIRIREEESEEGSVREIVVVSGQKEKEGRIDRIYKIV